MTDKELVKDAKKTIVEAGVLVLIGLAWSMITISTLHISANELISSAAGLGVGLLGCASMTVGIVKWARMIQLLK